MSEELLQRDLLKTSEKIGVWDFYNIGATSIKGSKRTSNYQECKLWERRKK
jgi:hypothetical protein